MSARVRVIKGPITGLWLWRCVAHHPRRVGRHHPTHAEALAAAWAHIKEHS